MTNAKWSGFAGWFLRVAALAAANFLAGRIALLLDDHTGFVSTLFPPAGISLAALAIGGYRLWPGVFVGSVCLNTFVAAGSGSPHPFFVAAAIATGSSLQAVIGAYLIRHVVSLPAALYRTHEVVLFLLLGGPVACLVAATVGNGSLSAAGVISAPEFGFSWFRWWIGDTIGVLIFTPLLMIALAEPREIWRSRWLSVGLPLCVACALAIFVSDYIGRREKENMRLEFVGHAAHVVDRIQAVCDSYREILRSIKSFYASSNDVNRHEFGTFVAPALARHAGIQAIAWVPRVLDAERSARVLEFQKDPPARADIELRDAVAAFAITERSLLGETVTAAERTEYFPVLYIEPYAGNERALGFDLGSESTRLKALTRARESGRPIALAPIRFVPGDDVNPSSILIAQPIYKSSDDTTDRSLQGFAVVTFRIAGIVAESEDARTDDRIRFQILDTADAGGARIAYASDGMLTRAEGEEAGHLALEISRNIGGRPWVFQFQGTPAYTSAKRGWQAWFALISGLIVASLVGVFTLVSSGRTARVEMLVSERTSDLNNANRALTLEIGERRRAQEALALVAAKLALPTRPFDGCETRYSLRRFSLTDMMTCGVAVRGISLLANDAEQVAKRVVKFFFDSFVNEEGQKETALVRMFWIRQFQELSDELQEMVLKSYPEAKPQTVCVTLASTAGEEPAWNDITKSSGHRVIPISSPAALRRLPMISNLLSQLGFEISGLFSEDVDMVYQRTGTGVFHVEEALGSDVIPAQVSFVLPHGINSVIGFGDRLPDGRLFAVILFAKVPVTNETALLFSHLALSLRIALLPFVEDPNRIEDQITSLDQLLTNHEEIVASQEAKLHAAMRDLERSKFEAEKANRAKSDFLANISHEIRTPLHGVIGMTELALDGELDSRQREYLEAVQQSAQHLLAIVNDVLDFSKIAAGRFQLSRVTFGLHRSLDHVIDTFRKLAEAKGLQLECHFDPELPDKLVGDPIRLCQVVTNLLGNAIKFTDEGEIALRVQRERRADDDVIVRFTVADTGVGIPQDKQREIFQAFSQADMSTTRRHSGTGLGLAISAYLVQQMKGRLWVESEVDKGSQFHFTARFGIPQEDEVDVDRPDPAQQHAPVLPVNGDEADQTRQSAPAVAPATSRMRVLLAEDGKVNQKLAVALLEKGGHSVVVAENGEIAVDLVAKQEFDVVLMDVQMPVMDGIDATIAIREQERTAENRIPIIALTAHAMAGDRERCLDAGMDDYLSKPLNPKELYARLNGLGVNKKRQATDHSGTERCGDDGEDA